MEQDKTTTKEPEDERGKASKEEEEKQKELEKKFLEQVRRMQCPGCGETEMF